MRDWLAQRRRKAGVAKRSGSTDAPELAHALDFFIWSMLDDHTYEPQEPRPFGDDERYYNAILNRYYDIEEPSTAEHTMPRMYPASERPEGAFYMPHYFPDADPYGASMMATVKDSYVTNRLAHRHGTLQRVAEFGHSVEGVPRLPSADVLVNPDAYPGYYNWLRDQGARFADSTLEQREEVTVLAPMAAVIAPGVADLERILFTEGWVEVSQESHAR